MVIKAVIFDLDGVLIDSLPSHYKSYVKLYSRYGIKYPFSEFISRDITAGAMNAIPRVLREHGKDSKEIEAILKERKRSFRKLLREKNQLVRGPVRLNKGVLPLLKDLKKNGYKMAVASGGTGFFVHHILRQNKIRKYFSAIVTGEDHVRRKPYPDIFLHAAKKLKAKPRECLVIEDARDGIAAAKLAGMKTIGHYQPRYKQDLRKADKIVRSMGKINSGMIKRLIG